MTVLPQLQLFAYALTTALIVVTSAQGTQGNVIKNANTFKLLSLSGSAGAGAGAGVCLPTNLALTSKTVYNDLHCNALCNMNVNCSMYMLVNQSICYLYAGMTNMHYTAVAFQSSNSVCKIYSNGWANCPASNWVFNDKYYYLYPTQMSFQDGMNFCRSAYLMPLKIENEAERLYIYENIWAQDNGSPKYYWTSLYGSVPSYSSGYNLTWMSDGSVIPLTTFPQSSWIIDFAYQPNLFCWIIYGGKINDNSCDLTAYAGRPLCTCEE